MVASLIPHLVPASLEILANQTMLVRISKFQPLNCIKSLNELAAKLALVGLTQVLAKEGFGDNILVNAICPIGISTSPTIVA